MGMKKSLKKIQRHSAVLPTKKRHPDSLLNSWKKSQHRWKVNEVHKAKRKILSGSYDSLNHLKDHSSSATDDILLDSWNYLRNEIHTPSIESTSTQNLRCAFLICPK